MAELLVSNGACAGTVFFLEHDPTIVGRSEECHVVIPDPWISSRHCRVEMRSGEPWIVDLGSRNGTCVDGRRVHEAALRDGSRVALGRTEAVVRTGEPQGRGGEVPAGATAVRFLADVEKQVAGLGVAAPGAAAAGVESAGRQLAVLHAIGRALADAPGLDESLSKILGAVASAVRAERSALLLIDETGTAVPRAQVPPDAPPRLSSTIVSAATRARAGLLVADAQHDDRFSGSQSVLFEGIRSYLCVPIWAENRVLGSLVLDRGLVDPFTAADLELVTVAAYQAALAIERARLVEQARLVDLQRRRLLRHFSPDVAAAILSQEALDSDPLAVSVREEVTVLFSDVEGFTRLTEGLPALDLAELLQEYFHEMTVALFEEGGTLDKFMGDGLMAIFGAPVPVTDGPVRAIRCARRMLERLAALNTRLPPDRRLAVRIGINTGRVVAGNFGSPERLEFTVLGDTVNVASRLESMAGPGKVCVGRSTYDRTRALFAYRDLGLRSVKGRVAPVQVYELVDPPSS
ncbi:MAG TPA: adenylate/guanylate cyclase domain-containing protein [Anaeromyxobacteraceae bacterium]|nr:adenylate/guanylate cyclase domain-containing protein [Anaeromyxobacteraceae bacterium]